MANPHQNYLCISSGRIGLKSSWVERNFKEVACVTNLGISYDSCTRYDVFFIAVSVMKL